MGSDRLDCGDVAQMGAPGLEAIEARGPSVGGIGDSYDNALAETIIGLYAVQFSV